MPLPLAPLAVTALKAGGLALTALTALMLARAFGPARVDQRAEDALDEMPEGLGLRRPRDRRQTNAAGRLVRRFRVPGLAREVEIDTAFYARFRARKI